MLAAGVGAWGCKDKTQATTADAGAASGSASAASSASAPPVPALTTLNGFEGEIDLIAQSGDPGRPTQAVNMLVHGDRIRLDSLPGTDASKVLGNKGWLLARIADKKIDMVADQRKQVIEIDFSNPDAMKNLAKSSPIGDKTNKPNANAEPPPKLAKTGTKETIAGYSCEDWEVTSAKTHKKEESFCMADLPSTIFHVALPALPPEYAYAQDLTDGQHFPLRVTSYDERTGGESGRLEVKKFDPHPVDASKFELPADYAVIDVAQLMGSLGSHLPGMPSNVPNIPNVPNVTHHPRTHH
jgi:Domain of unknown function (DUF4412)